MKKGWKRFSSAILALMMVFTMMPADVFAAANKSNGYIAVDTANNTDPNGTRRLVVKSYGMDGQVLGSSMTFLYSSVTRSAGAVNISPTGKYAIDHMTIAGNGQQTPSPFQNGNSVSFADFETKILSVYLTEGDSKNIAAQDGILLEKKATPRADGYDVSLAVKGGTTVEGSMADVILVLDNSGSMYDTKDGGKTYAQITKEAADSLIEGVLTEANQDRVRLSVVRYGKTPQARTFAANGADGSWSDSMTASGIYYTSDQAAAKSAVSAALTQFSESDQGSTNIEGAFMMAQHLATQGREGVEKTVVFMTDGSPTVRYQNGTIVDDGKAQNTSVWEHNQTIEAGQSLSKKVQNLYVVSLVAGVTGDALNDKLNLGKKLFGAVPMKVKADKIDGLESFQKNTVLMIVNMKDLWEDTSSYVTEYHAINGAGMAATMKEIYEKLVGNLTPVDTASGSVTDIIPVGFMLTPESEATLKAANVTITPNADGTTTLFFKGPYSAGANWAKLPVYTLVAKEGYHGMGYTNTDATYNYTLTGTTDKKTAHFPKPVVEVKPVAKDDLRDAFVNEEKKLDSLLVNDSSIKLEDDGYVVGDLVITITDKDGKPLTLTEGSFGFNGGDYIVKKVGNDISIVAKTPGTKEFYYTITTTATKAEDNTSITLTSKPAKVTVTVGNAPAANVTYTLTGTPPKGVTAPAMQSYPIGGDVTIDTTHTKGQVVYDKDTRGGYTFGGWTVLDPAGTVITDGKFPLVAPTSLTGNWTYSEIAVKNINWYVNLAGDILDYKGAAGSHGTHEFTKELVAPSQKMYGIPARYKAIYPDYVASLVEPKLAT